MNKAPANWKQNYVRRIPEILLVQEQNGKYNCVAVNLMAASYDAVTYGPARDLGSGFSPEGCGIEKTGIADLADKYLDMTHQKRIPVDYMISTASPAREMLHVQVRGRMHKIKYNPKPYSMPSYREFTNLRDKLLELWVQVLAL